MSYDPPLKLTIPTPSHFVIKRGVHSTGGYGGNLRVRCTNAEYDLIGEEAEILGTTLANFCRWCAVRAAETLREHREQNKSEIEGVHDGVKE